MLKFSLSRKLNSEFDRKKTICSTDGRWDLSRLSTFELYVSICNNFAYIYNGEVKLPSSLRAPVMTYNICAPIGKNTKEFL